MTINKLGADWLELKDFLVKTIESSHEAMEKELSVADYHLARGEIRLARAIIAKVEPPALPEIEDENYG